VSNRFLDLCHEKRVVWDHLPRDVAEEIMQVASDAAAKDDSQGNEGPPSKKAKLKGRNKERPIEKRPKCNVKLCSSIVGGRSCSYGDRCKFMHDVSAFMAAKPKDINDKCYIFETYGHCPYGLTCRFGSMHINDKLENVTNEELRASTQSTSRVRNVFSKDLQHKLWKRKYDFSRAQEIFNSVNIKRHNKNKTGGQDSNSTSANNDANNDPSCPEDQQPQLTENCESCADLNTDLADDDAEVPSKDEDAVNGTATDIDIAVAEQQLPASNGGGELHSTLEHQRLGPVSDEDLVRLRPEEKRKASELVYFLLFSLFSLRKFLLCYISFYFV
jgi:tRNA-dihydrouridine synthase 3